MSGRPSLGRRARSASLRELSRSPCDHHFPPLIQVPESDVRLHRIHSPLRRSTATRGAALRRQTGYPPGDGCPVAMGWKDSMRNRPVSVTKGGQLGGGGAVISKSCSEIEVSSVVGADAARVWSQVIHFEGINGGLMPVPLCEPDSHQVSSAPKSAWVPSWAAKKHRVVRVVRAHRHAVVPAGARCPTALASRPRLRPPPTGRRRVRCGRGENASCRTPVRVRGARGPTCRWERDRPGTSASVTAKRPTRLPQRSPRTAG